MSEADSALSLKSGSVAKFAEDMSYSSYLALEQLLTAQRTLSEPRHHDELLFIIQHQTTELWLKLVLHELDLANSSLREDNLARSLKSISRIKIIFETMIHQWSILATLTPTEFAEFRDVLTSSGFQSYQYRAVEFAIGHKNKRIIDIFSDDSRAQDVLNNVLNSPSLYDEFLRYLDRSGFTIPEAILDRDPAESHSFTPDLVPVFVKIYNSPNEFWRIYETCEELVDLEENIQHWRFRHMRTVRRTIGAKPGTGGSGGVSYLRQVLDQAFFPELYAARTEIGS